MKQQRPEQLASGLEAVIRELGIGKKIRQYEVMNLWKEIVGEKIASVTEAEHLSRGKLFVRVSRPTWRNELIFLKKELIDKINLTMHEELVTDIIFR